MVCFLILTERYTRNLLINLLKCNLEKGQKNVFSELSIVKKTECFVLEILFIGRLSHYTQHKFHKTA